MPPGRGQQGFCAQPTTSRLKSHHTDGVSTIADDTETIVACAFGGFALDFLDSWLGIVGWIL